MDYTPTKNQLLAIKQLIDQELIVRGINVTTSLEYSENRKKLDLTSTPFQTFPVLHSDLRIESFRTSIRKEKGEGYFHFFIGVHARYKGNGTSLFSVSGYIGTDDDGFAHDNKEFDRLPKIYDQVVQTQIF